MSHIDQPWTTMKRRTRSAALVCMALVLTQAHAAGAQADATTSFADAHVHLNDPAAWVELMDRFGIDRAIVFRGRSIDNAGLIDAAARWPGRLLPFLSVSPEHREYRGAWTDDDVLLAQTVDSLLATGAFVGIGEISVTHFSGAGFPEADFDPDGAVMRGILAAARRHGVPITMHVEVTRLREFESLLAAFPDVTVIWAHGGYTPLVLAARLLTRHPNLVYELSARTWPRHPRSPDYTMLMNARGVWPAWIALIERMPDRFLVGTDASLRNTSSDESKIASVHNLLAQLSPATRILVAGDNLARILDRTRPARR